MTGGPVNPLALLPEALLLAGAAVGLLLGMWTPQHRQIRVATLAVLLCLASAVTSAVALAGGEQAAFHYTWAVDATTGVVRIVVALAAAGVIVVCRSAWSGHARESEVYVLVLLAAIGAIALGAATDLLVLVAAYLLASVPLYALAGFAKDSPGVEAALKYYLIGAFSGVLMLLGVAALVLAGGRTRYDFLASALPEASTGLVGVGVLAVLAGMAFKAGAVPVHFWVPDVAAGTSPAVAAFVTTVPKVGAVAAVFRLLEGPFAGTGLDVPLLVAVIAAASMTLGNLAAFAQDEVLRLLAYSTVSQVGYVFMIAAVAARTDLAMPALAIYLAAYAITNVGAFAAVAAAPGARTIAEWSATAGRDRWLVLSLVVCLLGFVGTPPTAVFVGKLTTFLAAADGGMAWLVVIAAVNTVASLFYYLRWIAPAAAGGDEPVGTAPDKAEVSPDSGEGSANGTDRPESVGTRSSILVRTPTAVVHVAAISSLALGVASGWWLTGMLG